MTRRPKIIIDGRKDAVNYWVGFLVFASTITAILVLIAWIAG